MKEFKQLTKDQKHHLELALNNELVFEAIANNYNHFDDYDEDYSSNAPCDNSGYCDPACNKCR